MKTTLKSALLAFLIFAISGLNAQKIYACENYTDGGEPIGTNTKWNIKPGGGFIYLLFNNGPTVIQESSLWVYIDKLSNGEYKPYTTKNIVPTSGRNWVVYDHKFTEAGDYRITFLNSSRELAREYINIKINGGSTSAGKTKGTLYYAGSKVVFAENIDTYGYPINPGTVFTVTEKGGYVKIILDNGSKPINSTKFKVYIDKKQRDGTYKAYDTKFYDTKSYEAKVMHFDYAFYAEGDYKVSIYADDKIWTNTGYLTIHVR